MIRTIQQAILRLHGVSNFVLGFAAARPPERDETAGQHLLVGNASSDVSEWLAGILDGNRRTIAPGEDVEIDGRGRRTREIRDDGGLLVITYAELEKMVDGCRSAHPDDRRIGAATARAIVDEFKNEQAQFTASDEIPF